MDETPSARLSLDALPAWARLAGVALAGVQPRHVDGRGVGLVATEAVAGAALTVPRHLVLSAEAVADYAKADGRFRQLLEAVAPQVGAGAPRAPTGRPAQALPSSRRGAS